MQKKLWIMGAVLSLQPLHSNAMTIQQAMDMAVQQHPMLQMAEQATESARGSLTERGAYSYNPELTLEPQRRNLSGGGHANDYYITLSQGVEMGGKRALRIRSAQAALAAADQQQQAMQQRLRIAMARAFVAVDLSQRELALRERQRDMLQQVSRAVIKQLELGQSNQLDLNLAQSASASAQHAVMVAQQTLTQSRQHYRQALGRMQVVWPDSLPKLSLHWHPPKDSYKVALTSRPDLSALHAKSEQAAAQSDLAAAIRTPDITINAMAGREAGEQLIKLGVSVPFQLLNNHQGAYRAAEADKLRAAMDVRWSQQQLRYALQSARDNHRNAMQALTNMRMGSMEATAKETIDLARKAYDAGELDLEELVVHIRQGLDAQLTVLEMIKQGWLTRIRLAEVMGRPEYITTGVQP
ncbi:MAG: TolC family protein [Mariprofundales bacterium]